MSVIPKNCWHCFYWTGLTEAHCLAHNIHTSNVETCESWRPAIKWLSYYDMCFFEDYKQYMLSIEYIKWRQEHMPALI